MKDQEDFHGDIGLAPAETAKTLKNPKSLKTAGFMPEEDALLEEDVYKRQIRNKTTDKSRRSYNIRQ